MGNQVLVRTIQDRVSAMSYIPAQPGEDSLTEVPEYMSLFFGYTNSSMSTADNADVSRNDYYAGVNLLASEDYVVGIAGSMSEGSISAPLGNADSEGFGAMIFGRLTVAKSFTFFGSFGYSQPGLRPSPPDGERLGHRLHRRQQLRRIPRRAVQRLALRAGLHRPASVPHLREHPGGRLQRNRSH
jgi:hypothetical protein